jgi:hypothetical protein
LQALLDPKTFRKYEQTARVLRAEDIETRFYEVGYGPQGKQETWSGEHLVVTSRKGEPINTTIPALRGVGALNLIVDSKELDLNN